MRCVPTWLLLRPADLDLLPAGIPDDFTLFLPTNDSLKEVLVGGPIPSVVRVE